MHTAGKNAFTLVHLSSLRVIRQKRVKIYGSTKLQNVTEVCIGGTKCPPKIQMPVKFRVFV